MPANGRWGLNRRSHMTFKVGNDLRLHLLDLFSKAFNSRHYT